MSPRMLLSADPRSAGSSASGRLGSGQGLDDDFRQHWMPLTPLSYAAVVRRTYRQAFYY